MSAWLVFFIPGFISFPLRKFFFFENMKIYKDVKTGDELFSDVNGLKDVANGWVYEVAAKYVTIKNENDFDIGGNASAEEAAETLDDGARQVIDLVHNQQLCETSYAKKDYMAHIKNYMKILADLVPADQKDDFQKNAQAYVKEVLGGFDDYCFYTGGSAALGVEDGMVILCKFAEDGMTQKFYFWRPGVKEEKV